jgi:adenosine deaminase
MPMHPLAIAINHGIPVCLCSDDPAVFGSMGLSFDYYQVLVASEITGLMTLGKIARDSLKVSLVDEHLPCCINNNTPVVFNARRRRKSASDCFMGETME